MPRVVGAGGRANGRTLIVGLSTRAIAQSAVRAGYECVTLDRFGDLDQKLIVANTGLMPDLGIAWTPWGAARAASRIQADHVVYGANFENHAGAVERLARERELLGVEPAALRRVRNPVELAARLRERGVRAPVVLEPGEAAAADPSRRWLRKPRVGGGGGRIRPWRPGTRLGSREVAQEHVPGLAASAALASDGRKAVVLGLSRQIIGDAHFGASGFRYCGSVIPLTADPALVAAALRGIRRAGAAIVAAFGLRGLFGIDFVLSGRAVHVIEVNPRFTASMELIEHLRGISIFDAHVRACRGSLPHPARTAPPAPDGYVGKAILFARRDLVLGDTRPWLERPIADVPRPGTSVPRGSPICTLFATGSSAANCAAALRRRARALELEIAPTRAVRRLAL